jgi:hypothetical protein
LQGGGEGGIAEGGGDGDVVREGVEPDVGDEVGIEGDGDAPVEAGGGPGAAEVFEGIVFEEAEDFVAAVVGFDEVGMGLDVIDEPGLVFAESEVIVFLDQFDDLAVEGVEGAVGEAVFFGEERFPVGWSSSRGIRPGRSGRWRGVGSGWPERLRGGAAEEVRTKSLWERLRRSARVFQVTASSSQ